MVLIYILFQLIMQLVQQKIQWMHDREQEQKILQLVVRIDEGHTLMQELEEQAQNLQDTQNDCRSCEQVEIS